MVNKIKELTFMQYCYKGCWTLMTSLYNNYAKMGTYKILAKMANGQCVKFFVVIEIEKYAFSFDIHPLFMLLDQSTCGNNYHGNICMVIITMGTLV